MSVQVRILILRNFLIFLIIIFFRYCFRLFQLFVGFQFYKKQFTMSNLSVYSVRQEPIAFKILLLGCSGVGKTSLQLKYTKNIFSYDYNVTVGIQYNSKILKINQKTTIKLQIWDTVGQEKFQSVVRSLYKGVAAVLLIYSIQKKQSFEQLGMWMNQVKQHTNPQTLMFVVGCKLDLQDIRKVSKSQGQNYTKNINGAGFSEVSSKTGQNVKELFEKLGKAVLKKYQTNATFRNLVKPIITEDSPVRSESHYLHKYPTSKQAEQKKKQQGRCC